MDNDDALVGRLLSRREMLIVLGGAAGGLFTAGFALSCRPDSQITGFPSCVARPQQTEGPYFVDEDLRRSDIREDPASGAVSAGIPLVLTFVVSRITDAGCEPLRDATVDVWQCDAAGIYSGVRDPRFDSREHKFLRGFQVTDGEGTASFRTIYPGWYPGRTVHIHFKIRTPAIEANASEFTSQLYFEDALTDRVHSLAPYAERGRRTVRNEQDGIFRRGGDQLMLAPDEMEDGYTATFSLGLVLD